MFEPGSAASGQAKGVLLTACATCTERVLCQTCSLPLEHAQKSGIATLLVKRWVDLWHSLSGMVACVTVQLAAG